MEEEERKKKLSGVIIQELRKSANEMILIEVKREKSFV